MNHTWSVLFASPARRKLIIGLGSLLLTALLALFSLLFPKTLSEDARFAKYTNQIFAAEVCSNTISLHYTLADPSSYGIEQYPLTLGSMDTASWQSSAAAVENYQKMLLSFSREKLSARHRLTYDILTEYFKTSQEGMHFYLYGEPLSPTLGIQAQLPVLLAEYTFRTRKDISDYLTLLTQMPDYFQSLIHYEKEKAAAGLFMNDACANDILKQCSSFLKSGSDNCLRQNFNQEIDSFSNLTADEKISYKKQNEEILKAYVLPAYQSLMEELAKLLGSGKNQQGLYYFPEGTAYYTWLVHNETGDASSIEDLEARIKKEVVTVYQEIQTILKSAPSLSADVLQTEASSEPGQLLQQLQSWTKQDFPAAEAVSCQVKQVPQALQDYLSPAFYLIPPIDDLTRNVIYINPASHYNELELYTTLAHEGYPGHLYQTTSFEAQNTEPLRSILDFGGYTEGWATYVEMYSYSSWNGDATLARLYQKDRSFMLGLASLLDIGIHYRGYSRAQVASFLQRFGIQPENADALYNNILESPANYLKYYAGYLNFTDLGSYLQEKMGSSFSLKEYHRRVLSIGPCSFSVLKEYLTDPDYLAS